MEWQPIETAPKDGTPILIYEPPFDDKWPSNIYVCSWNKCSNDWVEHLGEFYQNFKPTHWMPLPKPPSP